MIFVFGTNILLYYIRKSPTMEKVERQFDPLGESNESWLSAVTLGEIRSIALQNIWGEKRISQLDAFLSSFLISGINVGELIRRYAELMLIVRAFIPPSLRLTLPGTWEKTICGLQLLLPY